MGKETSQQERERSWDGLVRREVAVDIRIIDEAERSVEVIASTEALDSHGDIVKQFWDLTRYNKNGPVLWNHNIFESSVFSFGGAVRPEDVMPVGKGENVRVENNQLTAKLVLVKGSEQQEPLVDKLWRRIQQGVIKAVSVGFKPGQVTRVIDESGSTDFFELGSKERPNELREISFVPMGSNPEAVAKSIAWERRHLDASLTDPQEKETHMKTDIEKALEKANSDLAVANDKLKTATERADSAEKSLSAEKTLSAKLTTDLEESRKQLAEANASKAKTELDARQAKKFAPAEREELDALVKDVGIDRVCKLLDARADIALTKPVDKTGDDSTKALPPPPVEGDDPSADIANQASKGLN
jgi:hypothetical protein